MSLDKSIMHGKEHRKPYSKAKAVDSSCRNHGDCDYCRNNRLYSSRRREEGIRARFDEYYQHDSWMNTES